MPPAPPLRPSSRVLPPVLGALAAAVVCAASTARADDSPGSPARGENAPSHEVFELHLTAVLPAAALSPPDDAAGARVRTQPAAGVKLTGHPIEHSYIQLTLLGYPLPAEQEGWAPDFTYSLGYGDWRPGSWFVDHSNYTATRYPWRDREGPVARPLQGVTTVGWRYGWPERWREAIGAPDSVFAGGSVMLGYAPRFGRLDGTEGRHLTHLSHSTTVTLLDHIFGELRLFWYPVPDQQQVWDPDFTYALGWLDWRDWRASVRWANYSGNRYPGRRLEGNGGVALGALFVDFKIGL